jgi:predicted AAA+ superfamily ATPase
LKMEWYEDLDFDENPFDTNPKRFSDKLVGMEELHDEIVYRINAGSLVFLEGKAGSGKTSILWNVIKRYRGKGRVIYVDCAEIDGKLNIEKLILERYGIFGRMFGNIPRNMILLLDNVSELSSRNMERIKYFFDEGYISSAVFTGLAYSDVKFSKSIKDRVGRRVVSIKELEPYQAVSIARNRLGNLEMISDELIEAIFMRSGKSIRAMLENLETLFARAVENKAEKITKEDLRAI